MKLIKLYRELLDFRKEYIKRLNLYDHLWIYYNSSRDAETVKQIIEIEKNIK